MPTSRFFMATLGLVMLHANLALANEPAAGNPPKVVYQWNPAAWQPGTANPWRGEDLTRPDGTAAKKVSGLGQGYNNYLYVPPTRLKRGHEYTAIVRYEIVDPTRFPDSFYIFARSRKLGQAHDYWRVWNGEAGEKGVAKLTVSLKGIKDSDDWAFHVGCKGPGTMIVDSFQVLEGSGLHLVPANPSDAPRIQPAASTQPATRPLPTGARPFSVEPPSAGTGLTLSTADFGFKADGPGEPTTQEVASANFTALGAAIRACREKKASVLIVPRGVYRLSSNFAVPLTDLTDLTIDGQGSEFIFQKLRTGVEAVSIQRCQRLVLKNLKLDWDWSVTPIASLARVVSVAPDGKSCELSFPDLNAEQVAAAKKAPWHSMIAMNPQTMVREGFERTSVAVAGIEDVDPKTLKVSFKNPVALVAGKTYCVRHLYYEMGAFKIGFSNDLLFEAVDIYSMPGMGWFFTGDMRNWKLVNCKIERRPGSRNPLTTAADGFHVSQSQGNLAIENCEFSGSGDDSINIHDNVFQGVQRVDETTLSLINCPPWRLRIQVGDRLELFKQDYAPLGFSSIVKSVVYKDNNTTVTLQDALPSPLSTLSIALNRRYDTNNVRIANSKFHDTNGRAILLSARDATIENCQFRNAVGTAIQFHTEIVGNLWAEGNGASNVVVRGNTFEATSFEGRYDNAVIYAGAKLPSGITGHPLFHDLLIEGNSFVNSSGPAVSLHSAQDVLVRNNQLSSPAPLPAANFLSGALHATHASNLAFIGNIWASRPENGWAGAAWDPESTKNISALQNEVSK